jgi:hypothetical protein
MTSVELKQLHRRLDDLYPLVLDVQAIESCQALVAHLAIRAEIKEIE